MTGVIRIGLTGGIAAGKSVVLQRWQSAGVGSIEADVLAHEALAPDTPTWAEVCRAFGRDVLNADRTIDRQKLGDIVFADETKRLVLNRIIHPVVRRRWNEMLGNLGAEKGTRLAAVSVPLLYEVEVEKDFDVVVVVACSEPTQLARLAGKGLTEAQARARIRAQWPLPLKMDRADFVIWNDGTLATAYQQADIVLARIREDHHASSQEK